MHKQTMHKRVYYECIQNTITKNIQKIQIIMVYAIVISQLFAFVLFVSTFPKRKSLLITEVSPQFNLSPIERFSHFGKQLLVLSGDVKTASDDRQILELSVCQKGDKIFFHSQTSGVIECCRKFRFISTSLVINGHLVYA